MSENTPNSDESELTEVKLTGPIEPFQDWLKRVRWSPDGGEWIMPLPDTSDPQVEITQERSPTYWGRDIVPPFASAIPGWENLSTEDRVGLLRMKIRRLSGKLKESE